MRLKGKVAIITGGTSGIGEVTARQFAQEGAKVVVAGRNQERGEMIARSIRDAGGDAFFFKVDVSNEEDVAALVRETLDTYGKLDVMFANAGVGTTGDLHEVSLEDWNSIIDINLTGVFLCSKYAIPAMLKNGSGSIINCASILGHIGQPHITAYAAAKGGVVNMTRTSAVTYASQGIRINAVCPGYIDTPMLDALDEEAKQQLIALHPIRRLGTSEEVAHAVVFLASDEASFITGTSLMVDGGYTAQ